MIAHALYLLMNSAHDALGHARFFRESPARGLKLFDRAWLGVDRLLRPGRSCSDTRRRPRRGGGLSGPPPSPPVWNRTARPVSEGGPSWCALGGVGLVVAVLANDLERLLPVHGDLLRLHRIGNLADEIDREQPVFEPRILDANVIGQ